MNSIVKSRLKEYCKYLELPFEIFAEDIGAAGELIYEKSELYEDTIVRIAKRHPELDINWLFTGKGNMVAIELEYPQSVLEKMA